jgi:hypothetical protein
VLNHTVFFSLLSTMAYVPTNFAPWHIAGNPLVTPLDGCNAPRCQIDVDKMVLDRALDGFLKLLEKPSASTLTMYAASSTYESPAWFASAGNDGYSILRKCIEKTQSEMRDAKQAVENLKRWYDGKEGPIKDYFNEELGRKVAAVAEALKKNEWKRLLIKQSGSYQRDALAAKERSTKGHVGGMRQEGDDTASMTSLLLGFGHLTDSSSSNRGTSTTGEIIRPAASEMSSQDIISLLDGASSIGEIPLDDADGMTDIISIATKRDETTTTSVGDSDEDEDDLLGATVLSDETEGNIILDNADDDDDADVISMIL